MSSPFICNHCEKPEPTKRCARCKLSNYCDATCQRAHYAIHKPMCLLLAGKIDTDKALEMQRSKLVERFNAFTLKQPLLSMLISMLCNMCKDDSRAQEMIPVVALNEHDSAISVRMSPRLVISQTSVERFVKTLDNSKMFACLLELYPWTVSAGHTFVSCEFDVCVPADQMHTALGKMIENSTRMAYTLAMQMMSTAAIRADAMVFTLEQLSDGRLGGLEPPMTLLRRQVETLFTPKRLAQKQRDLIDMGTAEIQPSVLSAFTTK